MQLQIDYCKWCEWLEFAHNIINHELWHLSSRHEVLDIGNFYENGW